MTMSTLYRTFTPRADFMKENDIDACGYYFYEYQAFMKSASFYGWFWSELFTIEWDPQSYLANKALHQDLNYSFVSASMRTQNNYTFATPVPWLR